MSVFSAAQLAYLGERRLARIATVGADGTPHVTPVGMWSHNPVHDSIDVTGREFARSKKYRDVARAAQAAIVIDDLASTDPWRPRGIEIRGRAETVTEPHELIRIHPDRVIAWGLDEVERRRRIAPPGAALAVSRAVLHGGCRPGTRAGARLFRQSPASRCPAESGAG
jgi:pyridoxamine 5'-phosphate oxidase family protein